MEAVWSKKEEQKRGARKRSKKEEQKRGAKKRSKKEEQRRTDHVNV